MEKQKIIEILADYDREEVEKFASYCIRLFVEKNKDGTLKNAWIQKKTNEQMAELFRRVAKDGLKFDGEHVTLQSTGISYDYVAYKNKMLLSYPESLIDVQLVYQGDEFSIEKVNGLVKYIHQIKDPFSQKDQGVIGGYCVIKNKRGEFFTPLSREDIDKHRKVAKTDYIWKSWFKEMALKTVIKKACKQHFADIYQNIEENDNENYNLENPLDLELQYKAEIDSIQSIEELSTYWKKNKGKGKDFDKYVTLRKNILTQSK